MSICGKFLRLKITFGNLNNVIRLYQIIHVDFQLLFFSVVLDTNNYRTFRSSQSGDPSCKRDRLANSQSLFPFEFTWFYYLSGYKNTRYLINVNVITTFYKKIIKCGLGAPPGGASFRMLSYIHERERD